jgi:hypothetical protein
VWTGLFRDEPECFSPQEDLKAIKVIGPRARKSGQKNAAPRAAEFPNAGSAPSFPMLGVALFEQVKISAETESHLAIAAKKVRKSAPLPRRCGGCPRFTRYKPTPVVAPRMTGEPRTI